MGKVCGSEFESLVPMYKAERGGTDLTPALREGWTETGRSWVTHW